MEKVVFILIPTGTQHAQSRFDEQFTKLTPTLIKSNKIDSEKCLKCQKRRFTKSKVGNPKQNVGEGRECLLNIFFIHRTRKKAAFMKNDIILRLKTSLTSFWHSCARDFEAFL